jgi:hypothetical protein
MNMRAHDRNFHAVAHRLCARGRAQALLVVSPTGSTTLPAAPSGVLCSGCAPPHRAGFGRAGSGYVPLKK